MRKSSACKPCCTTSVACSSQRATCLSRNMEGLIFEEAKEERSPIKAMQLDWDGLLITLLIFQNNSLTAHCRLQFLESCWLNLQPCYSAKHDIAAWKVHDFSCHCKALSSAWQMNSFRMVNFGFPASVSFFICLNQSGSCQCRRLHKLLTPNKAVKRAAPLVPCCHSDFLLISSLWSIRYFVSLFPQLH